MSGVNTVNKMLENLFFDFDFNELESFIDNFNLTPMDSKTSGQKKKKKKRVRLKKKNKNKADKEQMVDTDQIQEEAGPTPSCSNEVTSNKNTIYLSIKAITTQSAGVTFRKRNAKCQYINFEYLEQTYMYDSREFIKSNVLNGCAVEIANKATLSNGMNRSNKNEINKIDLLQSTASQVKVKKRKNKKAATSKVNNKTEVFNEYYSLDDVEIKLQAGNLIKGVIRINPKNYRTAYIGNEDRHSQDYIITSVIDRNRALEGDVVILTIKPESEWIENQKSANVVYIYEKVHSRIAIGSLTVFYNRGRKLAAIQPRDKRIPLIVVQQTSLPPMFFKNPAEHEHTLFLAKITEWNQVKYAEGIILERVGDRNDLQSETKALLLEHQLDVTPFPQSVYKHLPNSSAIPEKEFTYREDLRKECVFTIDPLTARDLDDAVSCKKLSNGNLEVGVHIADVGFFLEEGTELDQIVSEKGTTIYLVDSVYHMLPVELCMHCSLLPGKDCLAFSVFFEMTEDGKVINERFARTIINSCSQLAYEHAQMMIDDGDNFDKDKLPDIHNGYSANDLCNVVNKLRRISANLRQKRFDDGALRIDQVKIVFRLNAQGEPSDFFKCESMEAHHLIEELMLLANITTARRILKDFPKLAFLRCHEPPNPRLMKETQATLENIGIHIDVNSSATIHSSLQNYCASADYLGVARNAVLNHLLAKPMTRARYFCAAFEENLEHYALSVDTYTHFTSPIRRYADIMVHRLLAASLGYSVKPDWEVDYVREIAANCNKQKYNAKRAGEASSDMFLAHYVERYQPFIQDAVVLDVREQSFHVMVLNTGSIVRMYLNNLGEGVKYKTEKVGENAKKLWRVHLTYANDAVQVIELFQVVKVHLKRKGNTFNLEGQLIQPG